MVNPDQHIFDQLSGHPKANFESGWKNFSRLILIRAFVKFRETCKKGDP